ncbi:hypothetical protein AJ85_19470 [Alkalihalobacillus alcalophilus ATCC 27647 = CGMCC 1.3604]|uniref:Uncharacterized protein n=1 Tax=Alkalihalobacillus alcalophilus ATCC 27647 = CGMCC 1.3604 TaxID=1218173 RepID=A0A4S4JVJ1_ALKAL|nr:hypothetical protein AJ85_19470 [Alkalihalobacillus alcalophilus ATCC 27647 = CGMCC 1.3604]
MNKYSIHFQNSIGALVELPLFLRVERGRSGFWKSLKPKRENWEGQRES